MEPSEILLHLAERSDQLYFCYDLIKGNFSYVNPFCEKFFGIPKDQVTWPALLNMIHSDDRDYVKSQFVDCLNGDKVMNLEFRVVKGDKEKWLKANPHLLIIDDKRLLMACAEDITVYKEQNQVLIQHNIKKTSILSIVTHDLSAPIGNIQTLSSLLSVETENLKNTKIDEYLKMLNKISKSCIKLIRDFMTQEFLETAGVKLLKRRIELVEKFKAQIDEYQRSQIDRTRTFTLNYNNDVIYAAIDEDKFFQVINNLISNALKFTRADGTIAIGLEEKENTILVTVTDDGVGIPQHHHLTLFDKFNEARRKGLNGEHSTGLGMSIIKTIVDWHQGKIWFDSVENRGTTFYIEFPKQ